MRILFDQHDLPHAAKLRDRRYQWLMELGAGELSEMPRDSAGYLFAYQQGEEHYRSLVGDRPNVLDRPEQRQELLRLDDVLERLRVCAIDVPTPKTWILGIDADPPRDLKFPLFVRTANSSWKRGGAQGRVNSWKQLHDEIDLLRKAFGWDATILAREWINVAHAGKYMFGDAPQEVRVWIIAQRPIAWSFHYLHVITNPQGFPPGGAELRHLAGLSEQIATAFRSWLIAADFIRDRQGKWWFLEAGPGSAAGTAHEAVFKYVADQIQGGHSTLVNDAVGGRI